MSITKNWDLHGSDGHWMVTAKPTALGSTKIELSIGHSGRESGPVTRDFRGDNDRSIKVNKLVAELVSPDEIAELADLLHALADAVKEAQA